MAEKFYKEKGIFVYFCSVYYSIIIENFLIKQKNESIPCIIIPTNPFIIFN